MKLEVIQCLIKLSDGGGSGLTEVIKAGPSAVTVPEIAILQALHNTEAEGPVRECVSRCRILETREVSSYDEIDRLGGIYGRKFVASVFPGGRGLPLKLSDLNLPDECMEEIKNPNEDGQVADMEPVTAREYRAALKEAGVKVPPGNISVASLKAMMPDLEKAA